MPLGPKPASTSSVESTYLVLPHHTNAYGTIFGGTVMAWIDTAAACVAYRHCRKNTVTVNMDDLTFYHPIRLGDIVILKAQLNSTGTTSMEVGVKVIAENPLSGKQEHTATAYLTFVAVDQEGKPTPVPALTLHTEDDKRRHREAEERRKYRLSKRKN